MSWTSPQDIADRWVGEPTTVDANIIQILIDDVEALILKEYPAIQGRIDNNTLPLRIVQQVVARVVIAYIKSENSPYASQTQTVGPYSRSVTLANNARTSISLTNEDIADLAPTNTNKAFSIDLGPNADVYRSNNVGETWFEIEHDEDYYGTV
jgi:hypothetical protein